MRLVITALVILVFAPSAVREAHQNWLLSVSYGAEPEAVQGRAAAGTAPPQRALSEKELAVPSPKVKVDGPTGDTSVIYTPKEVLEKADKAIETATTQLNIILTIIGTFAAVLATLYGLLTARHKKIEQSLSGLSSRQEDLLNILSAVEEGADVARQVSSQLRIDLLAHMDSDLERAIMDKWIKATESKIGINELEHLVNNLDMFHPFGSDVFSTLGHYYRYQAWNLEPHDLQQIFYRNARSYYRRAIQRNSADIIKLSDLHTNVAICGNFLEDWQGALRSVEKAMALRSEAEHQIPSILFEIKGYALMYLGRHACAEEAFNEVAEEAFNEVIVATVRHPRILYNVACNYALWGDHLFRKGENGEEKYQEALGLLPQLPDDPPDDTTYREQAREDPDFGGLRNHSNFGQQFDDWARRADDPAQ